MRQPKQAFILAEPYFPLWLNIFCVVASLFALKFYFNYFVLAGSVSANILLWSTRYKTIIDLNKKLFTDYFSLAGLKFNLQQFQFEKIDRIFITKEKITHAYRSRGVHRDAVWVEYTATLLFQNGHTEEIISGNERDIILSKIKGFSELCSIGIESRTTDDWHWIDLSKI